MAHIGFHVGLGECRLETYLPFLTFHPDMTPLQPHKLLPEPPKPTPATKHSMLIVHT